MVLLESQMKLKTGDSAPDFDLKGIDDKNHKLDDYLTQTQFMSAVSAFDNGQIKGTPWLVYSLQETEHLTDFYVNDESSGSSTDEYLAIALAPNADTTMPISNTLWQTWYENMTATFSSFSLASPDSYTESGGPVTLNVTDAPETESAFIPLVARTSANAVQIVFNEDAASAKTSGFDALLSLHRSKQRQQHLYHLVQQSAYGQDQGYLYRGLLNDHQPYPAPP